MILVTGGAGFIGSNLVAALEARGHTEIAVCDRLGRDDKWRNIAKRELAAILPPESLVEFLDRHRGDIEAVFHMGAISSTTEPDADLMAQTNFALSMRLWEWCAANGVRLLYASSAATYGDGANGFDDDFTIEGLARLRPLNLYGWSKHAFDRRLARLLADGAPAPPQWVGLKFFNVYGPNEYHKGTMASVVSRLYPQLVAGEPARLFRSYRPDYRDGGQMRDFVWVGDCTAAMLWLYDHPEINGLFNVGSGRARTWLDLVRALFAAIDAEPRIAFIDMPEELRANYQYFTEAPMGRLRDAGWDLQPTALEDGVRLYVRGYLAAADPYA